MWQISFFLLSQIYQNRQKIIILHNYSQLFFMYRENIIQLLLKRHFKQQIFYLPTKSDYHKESTIWPWLTRTSCRPCISTQKNVHVWVKFRFHNIYDKNSNVHKPMQQNLEIMDKSWTLTQKDKVIFFSETRENCGPLSSDKSPSLALI